MADLATISVRRPKPRPCLAVVDMEENRALFHGFSMKAWTHGPSASIGGFSAGQESFATAVVELESGRLAEVPVSDVTMLDSKIHFICHDFVFNSEEDADFWHGKGGE